MNIVKRIAAGLVILLSITGFLLCVAGIVATWRIKPTLTEHTRKTFDTVNTAVDLTAESLKRVNESLITAKMELQHVRTYSASSDNNPPQGNFFVRSAVRMMGQDLSPRIGNAQEKLDTVTEAAVVVSSLLRGAEDIPLVAKTPISKEELQSTSAQLASLADSAQKLNGMLGSASPEDAQAMRETASRMDEALGRVHASTTGYEARVVRLQGDVARLEPQVFRWIDRGAIIITLALIWIALSQISMLVHGWKWFKH